MEDKQTPQTLKIPIDYTITGFSIMVLIQAKMKQ